MAVGECGWTRPVALPQAVAVRKDQNTFALFQLNVVLKQLNVVLTQNTVILIHSKLF
jgi:hypothetical protein